MNANSVYLIIVVVFMIGLMVAGLIISRGIESSEDWMLAGKSLGVIPMAGTYFATIVSSASIVSYMGYYYLNGWPGWWNCAGSFVTSFLACIWFAKRLRKTGCNSLPEFIEERFGKTHAAFASLLIVVCCTALLAAQVIGGITILQTFVNWNKVVCCFILLIIFLAFTALGGMKAVAWTDTICSFIIIVGVWVMAVKFLGVVGGFSEMNRQIATLSPDYVKAFSVKIPPITAFSWVITWGICNFGAPQFVARFFSAQTPEIASRSQGYTGIGLLLFYVPLVIIGISGMILLPGIEKQDQVFVELVTKMLSPVSGGIMFAAVIAAIISTADSLLLLAASTFSNDLWGKYVRPELTDKQKLWLSRVATIVIGIGAILATFVINDAIQFIQVKAVTLMGSSMAVLTMVGVVWKKANKTGAAVSMLLGFATACIWYILGEPGGIYAALPAIVVGFITIILVSNLTTPTSLEVVERFFPENEAE